MKRLWCYLRRRHKASLRVFDGPRVYLRCPDCGYETKGWVVK